MTVNGSTSAPVEKKVTAATLASFVLGIVVAILNAIQENPDLIAIFPTWLQSIVIVLIPTLVSFVPAYLAPHTPRSIAHRNPNNPNSL